MGPLFSQRSLAALRFDGARWAAAREAAPVAIEHFSALTLNLWFGELALETRTHAACALIEQLAPSLVALQEVTRESLAILADHPMIRRQYALSDARGETFDSYGTVLLSALPLRALRLAELGGSMGRTMPWAEISLTDGSLAVGAVHLESGRHNRETRAEQLAECVARLSPFDDAILMGDCNFADGDRVEERAIPSAYRDAWRETHPRGEPGFTRDTVANAMAATLRDGVVQRRIDRVFARRTRWRCVESALAGAEPIAPGLFVSDHFGVYARFERA